MKITNFKINNQTGSLDSPVATSTNGIAFNWSVSSSPGVYQKYSEINIGTSINGLGGPDFVGNLFSQGFHDNTGYYFELDTTQPLSRGKTYYGQVRVRDNLLLDSDYEVFAFRINTVPFVTSFFYVPEFPSLTEDLSVDFVLSKSGSSARLLWYKNGELQTHLTDFTTIPRTSLRIGQSWNAEIIPYDDVDTGEKVSLPLVEITQEIPSVDYIKIVPENPTENDILTIEYSVVGSESGLVLSDKDNNEIIWYVNGVEYPDFNNQRSVRIKTKPKDRVKAIITPVYDGTIGSPVETEEITISSSGFYVRDLSIEGLVENFSVNTDSPLLDWDVISPFGRYWSYVKINVGTFWGADNLFSEVIDTFDSSYRVPSGILKGGGDYYVSVAVSDDSDDFNNFSYSHFRMRGSLWKSYVNNTLGWAAKLVIKASSADSEKSGYYDIKINDGSISVVVSIFPDKIVLNSTESGSIEEQVYLGDFIELIISGKLNKVSLHVDGSPLSFGSVDSEFSIVTETSDRSISIMPFGDTSDDDDLFPVSLTIKEFHYLLDSTFSDNNSSISDMSFVKHLNFSGQSIDFLDFRNGKYLASINSQDNKISGKIVEIDPSSEPITAPVKSLDPMEISVGSIIQSPSGNKIVFDHNQGASIISGNIIPYYDVDTYFNQNERLESDYWSVVNTTEVSAYNYTNGGLVIDTTLKNIGRYSSTVNLDINFNKNVIFTIRQKTLYGGIVNYEFKIYDEQFIAHEIDEAIPGLIDYIVISIKNKTIQELTDTILSYGVIDDQSLLFGDLYEIEIIGESADRSTSVLSDSSGWERLMSTSDVGKFYQESSHINVSELDPDPYSYVSGGKCFFSHRSPGTNWFDYVSSKSGYTVDLDILIESIEDSRRAVSSETEDGFGIHVNDGDYKETIEFRENEIIFKNFNDSISFDMSSRVNFRLTSRNGKLKVFAKKDGDISHSLIKTLSMSSEATGQTSASSPCVIRDRKGVDHALWHDDSSGGRGKLWYSYIDGDRWSSPSVVAESSFGFSNVDAQIDSNNNIHAVFESAGSDYSDIAYAIKNQVGWSNPVIVSSESNSSSLPKLSIDESDNIHVVWQDNRFDRYDIFYATRNGGSGQWNSSAFGGNDVQISSSENGAFHPDIVSNNNNIFVAWSEETSSGGSHIKMARFDKNTNKWNSSATDGSDFQVDSMNGVSSDYPSVSISSDGSIHSSWHDIINGHYEIFYRKISSSLSGLSDIIQLTSTNKSSRYPKMSISDDNGNIFIIFQRESLSLLDPYTSIIPDSSATDYSSSLFYSLYDATDKKWRSSNSEDYSEGFDYLVSFNNTRVASDPNTQKTFSGSLPVMYSASVIYDYADRSSQRAIFSDAYYMLLSNSPEDSSIVTIGVDPYLIDDAVVSGSAYRKEIRVGDFSDSVSGKMNISYIRYSTTYDVDPFSIRLVNPSTVNSTGEFDSYLVNDHGDMWVTSGSGIEFYDFDKNSFYVLTSDDNIEEVGFSSIGEGFKNIITDRNGVIFVTKVDNGIYFSIDHYHFHKLDMSNTDIAEQNGNVTSPVQIKFDKNNNLILAYEDSIFIAYNIEKYMSSVNSDNDAQVIEVSNSDIKKIVGNIYETSSPTGKIEVDDLNSAWIPFRHGLLKLTNNDVVLYGYDDGIRGGEVLSVSIKSPSHRFICCENSVYEMIGDRIKKIDLRNSEIATLSIDNDRSQESYSPEFIANKYAFWTRYNSLMISSLSEVVQLSYMDEKFNTKKIGITKFKSSDYALVDEFTSNNQRKHFSIENYDDIYEFRDFFNVLINGTQVTNGYYFNPFNTQLSFHSPVLPTDLIEVRLQPGIVITDDFTPNNAEIQALGTIIRRPKKLGFQNSENRVLLVDGSNSSIFVDDVITQRPFDSIILDREPPVGKITIDRVTGPKRLSLKIERLIGADGIPIPYDSVSGIDKMIVSNYDNFTLDGEEIIDPVFFNSEIDHEMGDYLTQSNLIKEFTSEVGSSLVEFSPAGAGTTSMFFAASQPPSLYMYNDSGEVTLIKTFDEELDDSEISFITVFQNSLIVSIGHHSGIGKLYKTRDLESYDFVGSVSQNYISDFARSPYDQLLYMSSSNDGSSGIGAIYKFDGDVMSLYEDDLSESVNAITAFDKFIYAATGSSGIIYRLDVSANTTEIVHVDTDSDILSIGNIGVIVYAGVGSSGRAIRSSNVDLPFVNSFSTIPSSINKIKALYESREDEDSIEYIYMAVDNNLFKFDNAWTSVMQSTSTIRDFIMDSYGTLWVISDDKIQKVLDSELGSSKIYLKMIDKAGNATLLFSDPDEDGDGYNDNLVVSLDIETLRSFTNTNRILELDEFGEIIFDYDGDGRFYSADRVSKEVGVFYTEIFNASNNHVSWDKITWDTSIPENTEIQFYVRVGTSNNKLLESNFDLRLSSSDSGFDISFLNGQYLQIKAVLISYLRDTTPSLYKINVTSVAVEASHLFTTNFILPSRVKRGILTSDKFIPVSADIIFGINTDNSTEFNDYQIVGENRLFTTDSLQIGKGLRVGVRLLTPQASDQAASPPVEYGPYGYGVDINSVEFNYINTELNSRIINFNINFYNDVNLTSLVNSYNTIDNLELFRINGDAFPTGEGYSISPDETIYVSLIPSSDNSFICDHEYFTKISIIEDLVPTVISDERTFIDQCGISFIDNIEFDFQNLSDIETYDFRIKFYKNEQRTNLFKSYFSGNNIDGWFVNNAPFPDTGETFMSGETKTVEFNPPLVDDGFSSGFTYYLSIDAFDGDVFISQNNSYTFRAKNLTDDAVCGDEPGVPVLRSFAIMFELEDGEFVKFNVVS